MPPFWINVPPLVTTFTIAKPPFMEKMLEPLSVSTGVISVAELVKIELPEITSPLANELVPDDKVTVAVLVP